MTFTDDLALAIYHHGVLDVSPPLDGRVGEWVAAHPQRFATLAKHARSLADQGYLRAAIVSELHQRVAPARTGFAFDDIALGDRVSVRDGELLYEGQVVASQRSTQSFYIAPTRYACAASERAARWVPLTSIATLKKESRRAAD